MPCITLYDLQEGPAPGRACCSSALNHMSCSCSWPALWANSSQRLTEWDLKLLHSSGSSFRRRPEGLSLLQSCTRIGVRIFCVAYAAPCCRLQQGLPDALPCLQEQCQAGAAPGLASGGLQACLSSAGGDSPELVLSDTRVLALPSLLS